MVEFSKRVDCEHRAHCLACRTDPAWRQEEGWPPVCQYGVTPANARAEQIYAKAFPVALRDSISGCCDRADQF